MRSAVDNPVQIGGLEAAVRAVGEQLLEWRRTGRLDGRWVGAQFKAEVDQLADAALARSLRALTPAIPIVSEEDPDSLTGLRPETYWLVDPLDGTASFAQGFDGFVVQAALMRHRRPVLAAVYAPATDEMFLAEADRGATRNGDTLLTRQTGLTILTDNYPEPRGVARDVMHAFGIPNYLESGSIGLKICRVAQGAADVFVKDVVVRDWDVAPGHLVLTEAGGTLVDAAGDGFHFVGGFERRGLVAAAQPDAVVRIVAWLEGSRARVAGEAEE